MIYLAREKMIYIDIGYKSASNQNRRVTKDTKDKEATVMKIFQLWIKSLALA